MNQVGGIAVSPVNSSFLWATLGFNVSDTGLLANCLIQKVEYTTHYDVSAQGTVFHSVPSILLRYADWDEPRN